jgi:hypothetical protein
MSDDSWEAQLWHMSSAIALIRIECNLESKRRRRKKRREKEDICQVIFQQYFVGILSHS